jgi:hypothetical protein
MREPLGRETWRVEEPFADGDGERKYVSGARVRPFGLGKSVLISGRAVAVDGERRVAVLRTV